MDALLGDSLDGANKDVSKPVYIRKRCILTSSLVLKLADNAGVVVINDLREWSTLLTCPIPTHPVNLWITLVYSRPRQWMVLTSIRKRHSARDTNTRKTGISKTPD